MEEGRYFINDTDAYTTYGLVFAQGTYSELLTLPKKKPVLVKDWGDQNGTQRMLPVTPFFESITYTIPVYHYGANETDFYTKYAAFTAFLQSTNYFTFDVVEMNRRFVLLYDSMPSFDKLTLIRGGDKVYCKSTLSLINDYPTVKLASGQAPIIVTPPVTPTTLSTPSLNSSAASTTQVNLSWASVSNAQLYVLERANNSSFTTGLVTLYTGANLSYNDTGLTASTSYFYRLKATASGYTTSGYGSSNATTQSVSLTTPSTPTLLAISDVNDTFDFNYVTGYNSISQYEYTLDGGSNWTTASIKPIQVGNLAKAANQVGVRVKAIANTSNASGILYNTNAFTLAQTQGTASAVSSLVAGTPTTSAIPLSWTETNASLAHACKMVVIGSSTSAGNGASPIANAVINKITTYFQGLYNSFVTVNSAVAGQSSYQLLPTGSPSVTNRPSPNTNGNVTWAIAQNPSFVLINIPTNDTADGYTDAEYLGNLKTITNALISAGIKYFITTTQPRNTNQYVADSLKALASVIKNSYGVNVLDWYTPLANPTTNFIASAYDSGDGIHANNAGHALLFEAAKPAIQTYIENTIRNDYYIVQSLVSGSWTTIMNNVNRFLTSVQLTSLTSNTSYTLRIGSVTKGSGVTNYSSSVTATTAAVVTAPTSQRILIDMAGSDSVNAVSTDVDQWGKKWNTVLNAAVRNSPYKWVENPVDITNVAATGLILQASQDAAVGFAGIDSMNPDGYANNVGDYPASACRDSHYSHTASGPTNLTITVPAGKKITSFKIWGSRAAAGPRILQMKKSTDSTWQEYEAANNSTYTNAITITNLAAGTNVLNFQAKVGSTFGYIGIIDILFENA
jgi:lysophospholipase L1-like esterase